MKKKEYYEETKIDILMFYESDIITASVENPEWNNQNPGDNMDDEGWSWD